MSLGSNKWLAKEGVVTPITLGVSVFFLLLLFQPFGYNDYEYGKLLSDSFLSSIIVLLITFTSRKVTYSIFRKRSVNEYLCIQVLLDITLFLGVTFLINLISGGFRNIRFVDWLGLSLQYVLIFELFFIPLSLFIKHYFKLVTGGVNSNLDRSEDFNLSLHKVCLLSDTGNDILEVFPQEILLIKSSGNYMEVFYLKEGKVSRYILRSTLEKVTKQLDLYPFLFKCHRSYLINTDRIEKVRGNKRGYTITVSGLQEAIPVSRSKIDLFHSVYSDED